MLHILKQLVPIHYHGVQCGFSRLVRFVTRSHRHVVIVHLSISESGHHCVQSRITIIRY